MKTFKEKDKRYKKYFLFSKDKEFKLWTSLWIVVINNNYRNSEILLNNYISKID